VVHVRDAGLGWRDAEKSGSSSVCSGQRFFKASGQRHWSVVGDADGAEWEGEARWVMPRPEGAFPDFQLLLRRFSFQDSPSLSMEGRHHGRS